MTNNPRESFFKALNHYKAGQLDAAEALCKALLQLNPKEVNTLRLFGQTQQGKGRLEEAERAFTTTLAIAPDYAHAYMDLGALQLQRGELDSAESNLRKAISLNKNLHRAKRTLREVLVAREQLDEAAEIDVQLSERDRLAQLVSDARDQFAQRNFSELEKICTQVLEVDPGNVAILTLLADYCVSEMQARRAENYFRQVLDSVPESWRAWNGLSRSLLMQDRLYDARECLERSLEINPGGGEARIIEAESYIKAYEHGRAIDILTDLLAEQPTLNLARVKLGHTLKTVGRQNDAIDAFEECIAADESFGEAYWALSDMKTVRFSDEHISGMEKNLYEKSPTDRDRVYFGYALGKAHEHREHYREAFHFYQQANELQKTLVEYSAERNTAFVDGLIACFTPALLDEMEVAASTDITPIFIVGLPRSGSTLQEQILASHSRVEGTQELPYIPRIAKRIGLDREDLDMSAAISSLSQKDLQEFSERYLLQASLHRQRDVPCFIDKLPNNFNYIGLIFLLFPHAKIINARRHPIDSCLGCYKQLWAVGQNFTYDLDDLGRYYRDYDRLMFHWHDLFPGKILDVNYEQVVSDLPAKVRRLLDFCELPFESGCVDFHLNRRAVLTSSSEQVRQPIYRSAVAYWKNFGELLQPLIDSLGDLAIDR